MRLGSIQKLIMQFVDRCDPVIGVHIGSTTKAHELRGLVQVERALEGLVRRGILRREGIRHIKVQR